MRNLLSDKIMLTRFWGYPILTFAISLFFVNMESCRKSTPFQPPDNVDTTSHAFRWQVDMIGDGLSNGFSDIAVLNDSLAYAVGEVYLNDTSGNLDPILYNYAKWDGNNWKVKRLYYHFQTDSAIGPIYSIFAITENDVWFGFGNLVHWDGQLFQSFAIPPAIAPPRANKIWGTSDNNLYVVGPDGHIVHFDGTQWELLQTGSTLQVFDIWGVKSEGGGQDQILAVGSDGINKKLLSIQGTSITSVTDSGLSASIFGVWFVPNQKYYVVGAGIGQKDILDNNLWSVYRPGVVTSYTSDGVRGNATNDVFVTGDFMEIVHFNGSTWYNYRNEIPYASGGFAKVAVKGNLVIAVGFNARQAIAAIGKR
jgi:hypothetical protein